MEVSLDRLRRGVSFLKIYAGLMTVLVVVLFIKVFLPPAPPDILRVRGLVIEDAAGRERILIGAPIPPAVSRVRTDMAKVMKAWGKRFPNMDWYKTLDNATNGILILDENGFDRIAIGDPTPDPNIGRRIAPAAGIQINDQEGFERTGWGYFPAKDRVVLGLDSRKGQEGVTLFVLEDDTTGMNINAGDQSIFLGSEPGGAAPAAAKARFFGLLLREKDKTLKAVTPDGPSRTGR
ncbi:MAG: hypothetical protein ACXVJK_08910 [Candidatus Aminicenantales bacterium]